MKAQDLDAVNEIYACCDSQLVTTHVVQHEVAGTFARGLRELQRNLGAVDEDSYWANVIKPLVKYRFRIASNPLPFCSPFSVPKELSYALHDLVPRCKYVYPDYHDNLMRVADSAATLMNSFEAPLLDAIRDVLNKGSTKEQKGILIRGAVTDSFRDELRRLLGDPRLEVVTAPASVEVGIFSQIIAIGPLSWFPAYIRTAPRSRRLMGVRFDWLADHDELKPSFISSEHGIFLRTPSGTGPVAPEMATDSAVVINPNEVAPVINWEVLNTRSLLQAAPQDDVEQVFAHLLILSGNMAVYVDSSNDATSQIIDFSRADHVARISNDELEPSMYIFLRTGGGGDLVPLVADAMLGERAQEVRSVQMRWKSALRSVVQDMGEDAVLRTLSELGCIRANHLNLRNWMSDRNIRPQFDDDFLSILIVCGLDSDDKLFTSNARLLDRVHRRAGFTIRRMLLNRVGKANLDQLRRNGSMGFELPGSVGGGFTAFLIEEISPKTFEVPITYINHPFEAGFRDG